MLNALDVCLPIQMVPDGNLSDSSRKIHVVSFAEEKTQWLIIIFVWYVPHNHIRSSYFIIIIFDHHIWSSYLIIIYNRICYLNPHVFRLISSNYCIPKMSKHLLGNVQPSYDWLVYIFNILVIDTHRFHGFGWWEMLLSWIVHGDYHKDSHRSSIKKILTNINVWGLTPIFCSWFTNSLGLVYIY